jgi:hypothetical protein
MVLPPIKTANASRHKYGASPGAWEANRISRCINFAVSRVDQAVSQALRDDTVRKRTDVASSNPDHIGQATFVERTGSDRPATVNVIRQTGIRVEQ